MTIKEIEEITGMIRANIRYYEAEGLVVPERNKENGYRMYSREDAETLLKIKLLRSIDVPLEEIKALQAGRVILPQVLQRHLVTVEEKKAALELSGDVSRMMLEQGESFENLDPLRYLSLLEAGSGGALKQDVRPKLNLPWRRYWARCLDFGLCNMLVSVAMLGFRNRLILVPIFTRLTMLTVEPLLLSLFGTTVGKAIFGIQVTDREGGRLSHSAALERTWTVMWEGEAMRIPLISLYFQYKGLRFAEQEIPLSWEDESEVTYKDDKIWRYGLCGLYILAEYACVWWIVGIMGG